MEKYDIHKDFKIFNWIRLPMKRTVLNMAASFMPILWKLTPIGENVVSARFDLPGADKNLIPLTFFIPKGAEKETLPCLLFCHGGAFALKGAPYHKQLAARYAERCHCMVVVPDYRLSVDHPFPAGLEDCYSAYCALQISADHLNLDSKRIGVCGDSAGAALAVGVSVRAKRDQSPLPKFQMLIYPVTDDTCGSASMEKYSDTPMWNGTSNRAMWKMYLPDGIADPEAAVPARIKDLSFLPPTYLETAEFDCLHDEGLQFAERLRKADVPVTVRETRGTVHGYDMAIHSAVTMHSLQARIDFMRRYFDKRKR